MFKKVRPARPLNPPRPLCKGGMGGFASGAYSQYVSTAKWRERRWRLFSTFPDSYEQDVLAVWHTYPLTFSLATSNPCMHLHPRPFPLSFALFGIMLLEIWNLNPIQAEEPPVTTLDPIIVTGTANPTRLSHSTQSLTVIEREQYAPLHPNRIPSVLQQVPGLHIDEMGGRAGISSLYLRGADPNFTLIMLDGIPLNDSTNQRGGSADLSTIPIDQIERVEIIRGPLSAFYGSEAMAGAINLITQSASTTPYFRLLGEGGRFDYLKGLAQAGGSLGPFFTNFSLSHTKNGEQVEDDRFSQTAVGWNVSLDTDPHWNIRWTGQFNDSAVRNFPEGSGGSRFALLQKTEKRDTQEFLTGFTASLHSSAAWQHQLFLSASRRNQDIDHPGILVSPIVFGLPPATFDTRYDRFQARFTEIWAITPRWTFSLGGQVTYEQAPPVLQSGQKIAGIIATLGTTDAFGLDDIRAITTLRDELVQEYQLSYVPHIHADAVIGWAWSVFTDYSFEENPLGFRPRTLRALAGACRHIQHLSCADSIGIDFHKPGFVPYISSLLLVKEQDDLTRLRRPQEQMPYLYQFGEHRPGMYTLETSRSGTGTLSALANLKLFGKEGLRVIIGHIVEMAQLLREHLESHAR